MPEIEFQLKVIRNFQNGSKGTSHLADETILVSGPDIVTRGFVYVRENEELMVQAREVVKKSVESCIREAHTPDWGTIKTRIRDDLREFLYQKTKRSPMILPIIMEV